MPKKVSAKKRTASKARAPSTKVGTLKGVLVQGNIKAGRDVIQGNQYQYNDYRQQIAQIATPQQFIAEVEKMQAQIAEAKKQPALPSAQAPLVQAAEQNVQTATAEAKKDKPNPTVINENLKNAAATMDLVGKAITAAKGLGENITEAVNKIDWPRLAVGATALADLAARVFGPH